MTANKHYTLSQQPAAEIPDLKTRSQEATHRKPVLWSHREHLARRGQSSPQKGASPPCSHHPMASSNLRSALSQVRSPQQATPALRTTPPPREQEPILPEPTVGRFPATQASYRHSLSAHRCTVGPDPGLWISGGKPHSQRPFCLLTLATS